MGRIALLSLALIPLMVCVGSAQENVKFIREHFFLDAKEPVTAIALSSAGKTIAVASGNSLDGSRIQLWNVTDKSFQCI